MKKPAILTICLLALGASVFAAEVKLPARDIRAVPSEVYRVDVEGRDVYTAKFRDVNYAAFAFAGEVTVTVRASVAIKDFNLSPHSAGIVAEVKGPALTFKLDRPRQLVVTVNGGEKLFVFAESIDPAAPRPGTPGVTNVLDLGVDPTGRRIETDRLQEAIDRVAAAKGTLYFPPGVYLTGTLSLKSNLTLYLAEGARLLGSADPNDYPMDQGFDEVNIRYDNNLWARIGRTDAAYRRFILIDGAKNVRIAGRGTIDGQGGVVRSKKNVVCILVRQSSGVVVEDVTVLDAALYNVHVVASDRVTLRNLKIVSDPEVHNTDGIDPDSSRDVLIEGCFIYTADDCVSPKTSGQNRLAGDLERVTVRNCILISRTSGVKMGNESFVGAHRDVTFENIDVLECDRALTVSTLDGNYFENIRFIDVRVEKMSASGKGFPIQVHVRPRKPGMVVAKVHGVLFKNVTIEQDHPHSSKLTGFSPKSDIRGIRFENYVIAGKVRLNAADAKVDIGPFVSDVTFAGPAKKP